MSLKTKCYFNIKFVLFFSFLFVFACNNSPYNSESVLNQPAVKQSKLTIQSGFWPNFYQWNFAPTGYFDYLDASGGSGWAYDVNAGNSPIDVHIYLNGEYYISVTADKYRPDIVAAGTSSSPYHGFTFNFNRLEPGRYEVNIYAIDHGGNWNNELSHSPKYIIVPGVTNRFKAYGTFDGFDEYKRQGYGWAYDKDAGLNPIYVNIYADGVLNQTVKADKKRSDLVIAGVAPNNKHGFEFALDNLPMGSHILSIYAVEYNNKIETILLNSPKTINISEPKPDLIIEEITWTPANPVIGSNILLNVRAKNAGNIGTLNNVIVSYEVIGSMYSSYGVSGAIGQGDTISDFVSLTPWMSVDAGTFEIKAHIDPYNEHEEIDENNNTKTIVITIDESNLNTSPFGWFDGVDELGGFGWAYDPDAVSNPINVNIYVDNQLYITLTADVLRHDLVQANITPNPEHGFSFEFNGLGAGEHSISAKAVDFEGIDEIELSGSPKVITTQNSNDCGSCDEPSDDFCVSNNTALRVYQSNGSCINSQCEYQYNDISCPYGCLNETCQLCNSDCQLKQCGDDGCGGSCGNCDTDKVCDLSGICQDSLETAQVNIDQTIRNMSLHGGGYPRALQLDDGSIIVGFDTVSQNVHTIRTTKSLDNGNTWTDFSIVASHTGNLDLANAFPLQLENGRVLMAFRHHDFFTNPKIYRIEVCFSDDNGENWDFLSTIEVNTTSNEIWEPFMLLAPDGSLQAYYAREKDNDEQDIVMKRSLDNGQTWGDIVTVATKPGSRDGMPAVTTLSDGSLVTVFEAFRDNEWGKFIIQSVQSFDNGLTWINRQNVYVPADTNKKAGAPYIITLGNGQLMASFMTDENSNQTNWPDYASMKIVLSNSPNTTGNVVWQSNSIEVEAPSAYWPALYNLNNNNVLFLYSKSGIKTKIGQIDFQSNSGCSCNSNEICELGICKGLAGASCSSSSCTSNLFCEQGICKPGLGGQCVNVDCADNRICFEGYCKNGIKTANPVITGNHPDPHIIRKTAPDNKPVYYLYHTTHNDGDIPIYSSRDLINWTKQDKGAFDRSNQPGSSIEINGAHYCSIWAPDVQELSTDSYLLSFSAVRFNTPQSPCPAYKEDGGVYTAWSNSPLGPFAPLNHPWEPLTAGGHIINCDIETKDKIPHSVEYSSQNCQSNYCHKIIRLDSDVFYDDKYNKYFLAYSWYTNNPPANEWEYANHGEHVNITELDSSDPFTVICNENVTQIHTGNPHDLDLITKLSNYCTGCDQMLSFTKGKQDKNMTREGYSWGIIEGANMFRKGEYVYILMSGSAWDSAYYHVYWAAAKTVEELAYDNPNRLVGRYLIPGESQSFGHGSAVKGPDDNSWYYVYHRLNHESCKTNNLCSRDVWVSQIEFEDKGDGKGKVWIKPNFAALNTEVTVVLP